MNLTTVFNLSKGSVLETLLKHEMFRIDPFPHVYHASSDMNTLILSVYVFKRGHAVAQVVDALRHKHEDRGFDSPWFNWNVSLTYFRPQSGSGVDSATQKINRNFSWRVKAASLQGWQPYNLHVLSLNFGTSSSWKPQGLSRLEMGLLLLFYPFIT